MQDGIFYRLLNTSKIESWIRRDDVSQLQVLIPLSLTGYLTMRIWKD
jgi:hypothetical protein